MRKIPTLFERNLSDRLVRDEVTPGAGEERRETTGARMSDERVRRRVLTTGERDQAVTLYQSGLNARAAGAVLGVSVRPILAAMHARGLPVRGRETRRVALNESAFDTMSPMAAYWVGFLYADGHLDIRKGNQSPRVSVTLQERDRHHLEKLREFFGSGHAISRSPTRYSQDVVRLAVSSRQLVNSLLSIGMDKKAESLVAPDYLCGNRDFWRGMVDGDGTVMLDGVGRFHLRLCGRRELMEQFRVYCQSLCETEANVCRHSSIWRVSLTGANAKTVSRVLYNNACVSLDRKQQAAIQAGAA